MPAPLHIHIAEPCHENWQQMTPNEQGRHCLSCQKTVVDFTLMSDQEILDYISHASSAVCGRFNNDQLNKTYAEKKIKPSFTFRYAWNMLVAAFLLSGSGASAQVKKKTKKKTPVNHTWELKYEDVRVFATQPIGQLKPEEARKFITLGFVVSAPGQISNRFNEPPLKLFGLIRDNSSRKPVNAATVRLKGVKTGVKAGKDGRFEFPIIDLSGKVALEVTAKGYVTQEYLVEVNSFRSTEFFLERDGTLQQAGDDLGIVKGEVDITTMGKVVAEKAAEKQPAPESIILGSVAIVKLDDARPAVQEVTGSKKVTGVILDDSTGKPVSFASVRIKGLQSGVAANEAGKFSIAVPAGKEKMTVVVSGVGYVTHEFEIVVRERKSYTVMLQPAADSLEPIVVTGYPPIHCTRGTPNPPIKKDALPVSLDSINVFAGGIVITHEVTVVEKVKRTVKEWLPGKRDLRIYPNPVMPGNTVNISLKLDKTGEYKLELMDAAGRVVYVQALQVVQKDQVANVPTQSTWSRGIYWVRISNATDKHVYQAKILLQ